MPLPPMKGAASKRLLESVRPFAFSDETLQDVVSLGHCMTGWQHVYEPLDRGSIGGRVRELWLWPVQLIHESLDRPCVYQGSAWHGSVVFALALRGPGKMVCGGWQLAPGALAIYPGGRPYRCFVNGPVDNLVVCVDRDALAACSLPSGLPLPPGPVSRALPACEPEAVAAFGAFVSGVLTEVETQPALLQNDGYRRDVVDRTLQLLAGMLGAGATKRGRAPAPSARAYVVEKAEQYMLSRLADPIRVSDISSALRVAPRTLRYSFQDVVGVSPAQYLQGMRLNRVRGELLNAKGRVSIRSVAERHGFRHMGRFARFYRAAFGERPTDTCR